MRFLTKNSAIPLPAPPQMHNDGNYIVSLNQFTKWLGERAEEIGVEVYPGFAASEVLYKPDGSVLGVATNDLGIGRDGKPKDSFERGMVYVALSRARDLEGLKVLRLPKAVDMPGNEEVREWLNDKFGKK